NGHILQAENGSGKIHMLSLMDGDRAHVTVLKEGLKTPTAMEPGRGEIWIAERGTGKIVSIPMPKSFPLWPSQLCLAPLLTQTGRRVATATSPVGRHR